MLTVPNNVTEVTYFIVLFFPSLLISSLYLLGSSRFWSGKQYYQFYIICLYLCSKKGSVGYHINTPTTHTLCIKLLPSYSPTFLVYTHAYGLGHGHL